MERPYQFPVQVGSLTTTIGEQSFMVMRGDNVSGGKLTSSRGVPQGCPEREYQKRVTLSPTYWQGKGADRRSTNYVSLVKVTQLYIGMVGYCKGRPAVLSGKPEISGVVMGKDAQRPCRGKSRRYATGTTHLLSNWRGPDRPQGITLRKEGYKAGRLKILPRPVRKSEMTIVAFESGDSKTPESEGSLAFSGLLGRRSV